MDAGHVVVLVLAAVAAVFLVLAERNSRQNEARLKAEAAAKANTTPQAGPVSEPQAKRNGRRKPA
jgi:hypothetical protein